MPQEGFSGCRHCKGSGPLCGDHCDAWALGAWAWGSEVHTTEVFRDPTIMVVRQ